MSGSIKDNCRIHEKLNHNNRSKNKKTEIDNDLNHICVSTYITTTQTSKLSNSNFSVEFHNIIGIGVSSK